MIIETRFLGRKPRLLDRWTVSTPPGGGAGDEDLTLRALIARVVRHEVAAFDARARKSRLVTVLSASTIAEGAAKGKIDPGGRIRTGPVDADAAVAIALQAFEDGLYLVILDGVEQRDLDRHVYVTAESTLVFLRLTFLAGA